jgi:ribosomal protein S18 acetylase RimI-like enzyme
MMKMLVHRIEAFMTYLVPNRLPQTKRFKTGSLRAGEVENPIRRLEELSLNAWPALQTSYDDGWVLRFANGYTRRANSINPLYPSSSDLDAKIKRCEAVYSARKLHTVFKLTPTTYPDNLDDVLDRRHYREESPTSVQTLALDKLDKPAHPTVRLCNQMTEDWLGAFTRMNAVHDRNLPTVRAMLGSIVPEKCFISLREGNAIVAVGLGVLDQGHLGLFDIVTDGRRRRQGFGGQLVLHLLNWGKSNGAHSAYLQVMLSNTPALALYRKLGFREAYQYWYRVKMRG